MNLNKLKMLRQEKGYTLEELSMLTGISVGYICHLENGSRNNPSILIMEKLAQALNKSVFEIFFDE